MAAAVQMTEVIAEESLALRVLEQGSSACSGQAACAAQTGSG